jgi:hypothetical protein
MERVQPNQRFEPTAASVPLAIPSSLRSSAAAQAQRYFACNAHLISRLSADDPENRLRLNIIFASVSAERVGNI